jgi:hypothetical protein
VKQNPDNFLQALTPPRWQGLMAQGVHPPPDQFPHPHPLPVHLQQPHFRTSSSFAIGSARTTKGKANEQPWFSLLNRQNAVCSPGRHGVCQAMLLLICMCEILCVYLGVPLGCATRISVWVLASQACMAACCVAASRKSTKKARNRWQTNPCHLQAGCTEAGFVCPHGLTHDCIRGLH